MSSQLSTGGGSGRGAIARAALLLMLGSLLSRLLGLGREAVVVGLYGLTADSSSFLTAATVPTMVFDLLVGGAISAALVPVLSEQADDRPTFGRIVRAFLALAVVAMALVALVLELAAPLVVALLGAGREPGVFAETTLLLRIMLPAVLFLGAAGVVQAALQARGRFGRAALSAAGFNAGIIAAGLVLGPALGPPALAVGVVVGAALQLAIQWPGLHGTFGARSGRVPSGRGARNRTFGARNGDSGARNGDSGARNGDSGARNGDSDAGRTDGRGTTLRPDWRHPAVGRALRLYAPVAAGLVLSQVGIAIDRYLAWTTGDGSIALMRTATTLVQLPLGLVATALSFAVLPALSRAVDPAEFRRTLGFGVRLALLIMVPTTLGLVVLREPVLRLLFERGAFTPQDTVLTGRAFAWYAPQMPFWAVDQLLIFAFYARRDTRTPVLVGVFGTLLYLAVALATVVPLGVFGLILANTLQNSSHCVVMYWLLARRGLGLADQGLASLLARVGLASAAAWAVHAAALAVLGPSPPGQLTNLAWLATTAAAMTLVAVVVLAALRTPELIALAETIRQRAGLSP